MQIVSYRGPSQPGGVASLLENAHRQCAESTWWHIRDGRLQKISSHTETVVADIPAPIRDGHYRYSNEFLWPLMHGNSDVVRYDSSDHNCYRSLNLTLAAYLNWSQTRQPIFGQDYQLALLPSYLSWQKALGSLFFWHIPWPSSFPSEFEAQIAEVAGGILRCDTVGFHTAQYVSNFCAFVRDRMPEFNVMANGSAIIHRNGHATRLVVSPAGVDYDYWQKAAQTAVDPEVARTPYILSVDRADYTKGVAEHIQAIRNVFQWRPDLREKIQFVFICQRTRPGIAAYDEYWEHCRSLYRKTLAEFETKDWSPIHWSTEPVAPEQLAGWYSHAMTMLVNPSKDGLNLTAKEFVASATSDHGSLILSSGAGAWQELRNNVVSVHRCHPDHIAASILGALREPLAHRRANLRALKRIVRANSFDHWWERLTCIPGTKPALAETRVSA